MNRFGNPEPKRKIKNKIKHSDYFFKEKVNFLNFFIHIFYLISAGSNDLFSHPSFYLIFYLSAENCLNQKLFLRIP